MALLAVIVVGASAAAAHRYMTRRSRQETVVARAPTDPDPVPAPEATEEPVAWPAPSAEPAAAPEETSPDAAPAAAPFDAGTSNAQRPPAAQLSRRAEDPQLLLAAIRRVPITMYLTSWCPACRKAQAWWRANQLSVTEYDIDKDESAKQRCRALSGETSIPQFEIDGSAFVGFRPTAMWRTLTRAARRELDAMR